jgi:hypothetical protein
MSSVSTNSGRLKIQRNEKTTMPNHRSGAARLSRIKGLSPDFPTVAIREIVHHKQGVFYIEQGPKLPICAPIWERAAKQTKFWTGFLSDPNQGSRARPGENGLSGAGKTNDLHHGR